MLLLRTPHNAFYPLLRLLSCPRSTNDLTASESDCRLLDSLEVQIDCDRGYLQSAPGHQGHTPGSPETAAACAGEAVRCAAFRPVPLQSRQGGIPVCQARRSPFRADAASSLPAPVFFIMSAPSSVIFQSGCRGGLPINSLYTHFYRFFSYRTFYSKSSTSSIRSL